MNRKLKTIIIDDENLAHDLILKYLEKFDNIDVVAQCYDGFEGIKSISEHQPDLIFLDIQMPKLTGFEMIELLDKDYNIIFTTAYDKYALKAFEVNAVDYLLKPFSIQRFKDAVDKVIDRLEKKKKSTPIQFNELPQSDEKLNRIVVKKNNKIIVVPTSSIIYLEAQDDYVSIVTPDGKYLKQNRMKFYEENLPNNFVRLHRSYLVNLNEIKEISLMNKESHIVLLKTGDKIPVSKTGYKKLKEIIK